MIITRTPFRVSFIGGGSDIPAFYEKHGGCVISTSINKYMYISVHPSFELQDTVLKYSETEIVSDVSEIHHSYFKAVLDMLRISGVEIVSTADIPAGTGLGSSSSFTVGILHALYSYKGKFVSKEKLASKACEIEIDILHNPIGKQDQYAAAYGGLNFYSFNKDGSVFVDPIIMKPASFQKLEENLMMFYTGKVHSANSILQEQSKNVTAGDRERNQLEMCELTHELREELQHNNVDALGEILHEGWKLKRTLASGITNPMIDECYDIALKNGALGGKLLGAGGGGFLLFYVQKDRQQEMRTALDLVQMPISLDR
ncbi:MAG: GHMP kinase [Lachnospiraceae bacterium]|nr:GHMP kinase [Lachnospiraceae bacterium]